MNQNPTNRRTAFRNRLSAYGGTAFVVFLTGLLAVPGGTAFCLVAKDVQVPLSTPPLPPLPDPIQFTVQCEGSQCVETAPFPGGDGWTDGGGDQTWESHPDSGVHKARSSVRSDGQPVWGGAHSRVWGNGIGINGGSATVNVKFVASGGGSAGGGGANSQCSQTQGQGSGSASGGAQVWRFDDQWEIIAAGTFGSVFSGTGNIGGTMTFQITMEPGKSYLGLFHVDTSAGAGNGAYGSGTASSDANSITWTVV